MEEQQPVSPTQASSFMSRAANVFMSPGELYSEVATVADQSASWVIPMILAVVIAMFYSYTIFSNPTFRQQMVEAQRQALQQRVAEGGMTEAERAQAEEFLETSSMPMYIGFISSAIIPPVTFIVAALGLWLVGKFGLRSGAPYKKWLEVYGLSALLGVVGAIVSLITMHLFDSLHATFSGGLLLLSNYDSSNFVHRLIGGMTVFGIWQMVVVGIGLAKISGKPTGTGVLISFVLWLIVCLVSAATHFGI